MPVWTTGTALLPITKEVNHAVYKRSLYSPDRAVMNPGGMTPEQIAVLNRMAEIAFDAIEWVNQNAHNDYARTQMLRAVHYTIFGEDLIDA